tara:strand:- start:140695 stop:143091 length:2397 start_codon:yes stop_codon:yes gene_type:complete
MSKNLVIVESPAKATTIEKYLGKDFTVKSSYGHVRDLAKSGLSIDIENNFAPTYVVDDDKKSRVAELKKLAKKAEMVWLATDEDREGEAISWHLNEVLGLTPEKTKRITFNEITKPAILKAIEEPRTIDVDLVNAQQARRILDRIVGFELSPVLWKKVKPSLSAGRVQSVAVRMVVEREREIENFKSEAYFRVVAKVAFDNGKVADAVLKNNLKTEEEANQLLQSISGRMFDAKNITVKPSLRKPAAPFTTSTLQQEASRKFGFGVSQTMRVAQKLYEAGFITYMRTDSVNLSQTAMQASAAEIVKEYGEEYHQPRQFATKNKGAQEAHEAIRPTNFAQQAVPGESQEKRLYALIRNRTLASQMADAKLEKTTVTFVPQTTSSDFIAKGEVIKFDGFLRVYTEGTDDEVEDADGILPPFVEGNSYAYTTVEATERFTHHPARFTEASLVKRLEELGIGRPSTYAPTITTIQARDYVTKDEKEGTERKYAFLSLTGSDIKKEEKKEITGREKNKFSPTDIGMVVNDFLTTNFETVLNFNFTAQVESKFDEIAEGKLDWQGMLKEFYTPFHHRVEDTTENSERASGERILGKDPKTGHTILVRLGRFGPLAQIGSQEEVEKPRFASLLKTQSLNTITLEETLELFKLPRHLGELDGEKVTVNQGRFGPYVQVGKKFHGLKGTEYEPITITYDEALEVIKEAREKEARSLIKTFVEDETLIVKEGRYGPYIAHGKNNYKIPKDKEPASLTFDEIQEIIKNAPPKKSAKKAPAKKTAAKKPAAKKAPAKKTAAKKTTAAKKK